MSKHELIPEGAAAQPKDWPDDDEALLEFHQKGLRTPEYFSVKDAFEGVQVFGATGSGKSSGSGKALASAFLESNFGGLVLTAKTDERLFWEKLAASCGRTPDLLIFGPEQKLRFNFLRYELSRPGRGAGLTENLVNLFTSVLESVDRPSSSSGQNDGYWHRALKQLLRNTIDLHILALGDINLPSLCRIINSAPNSPDQAEDETWRKSSVCYALLEEADKKTQGTERRHDYEATADYWLKDFANLAHETRTPIVSMFTSMADCFQRGLLRELFCTDLNFSPEDCFQGRIILIDLPVKEFHELGLFAQVLFKYIWQRAVERRIPAGIDLDEAEQTIRPVFLYADESQFFVNRYDALFQSTARSSRASTVYLTQNLPGYQTALGGLGGNSAAGAFLGNLQTKVFHAQGDPQTNNWAADSIGRTKQQNFHSSVSQSMGPGGGGGQSAGGSTGFDYLVQPHEFTTLRTGGSDNDFEVDAIIFQGGRRWNTIEKEKKVTRSFLRHTFKQKFS